MSDKEESVLRKSMRDYNSNFGLMISFSESESKLKEEKNNGR